MLSMFRTSKSAFVPKRYAKQCGFLHYFSCSAPFVSQIYRLHPSGSAFPYSSLDAFWGDMLPVSHHSFCCIPLAGEPSLIFSISKLTSLNPLAIVLSLPG